LIVEDAKGRERILIGAPVPAVNESEMKTRRDNPRVARAAAIAQRAGALARQAKTHRISVE
jgi:hypothetical protein